MLQHSLVAMDTHDLQLPRETRALFGDTRYKSKISGAMLFLIEGAAVAIPRSADRRNGPLKDLPSFLNSFMGNMKKYPGLVEVAAQPPDRGSTPG